MGYRLYASIPNVAEFNEPLELGKQYHGWDEFNEKWFGCDKDEGFISSDHLIEFYNDMIETNKIILSSDEPVKYDLYNLEFLKDMIDCAIKNKYYVYFESF